MTEAAVAASIHLSFAPPADGSREDMIRYYWNLAKTPRTQQDWAELRRMGRDGLTLLCASPAARGFPRRRTCLVSTHFRAPRPKGRIKRI